MGPGPTSRLWHCLRLVRKPLRPADRGVWRLWIRRQKCFHWAGTLALRRPWRSASGAARNACPGWGAGQRNDGHSAPHPASLLPRPLRAGTMDSPSSTISQGDAHVLPSRPVGEGRRLKPTRRPLPCCLFVLCLLLT